MLSPDGLLKLIDPSLTVMTILQTKNNRLSEETTGLLFQIRTFLFIGALFILAVIIIAIVALCKCFKSRARSLLHKIKKKFLWNGLILSVTISYMKIAISAGEAIKLAIKQKGNYDVPSLSLSCVLTFGLVLYPIGVLWFLYYHRHEIESLSFREKYERLYPELRVRNGQTSWYMFFFLLRRYVICFLPIFLVTH